MSASRTSIPQLSCLVSQWSNLNCTESAANQRSSWGLSSMGVRYDKNVGSRDEAMIISVVAVGLLLLVPLRCAMADDIILLEKYLSKNTNLELVQSCQYQYSGQCNQSYAQCRNKCRDTSCNYNCCINFRSCMGAH